MCGVGHSPGGCGVPMNGFYNPPTRGGSGLCSTTVSSNIALAVGSVLLTAVLEVRAPFLIQMFQMVRAPFQIVPSILGDSGWFYIGREKLTLPKIGKFGGRKMS